MRDGHAEVAAALPEYEVGGELGRGAWGIVLAGRHRHLRRQVAIKRLPPAFAHDPEVRSRFIGEARLLSSLDHPHIVPVYDYRERDDLCLLVMEQLSGGSVWDRFTGRGIDTAGACAIGLVAAIALGHAHERGVLHRDIKPENLLFGEGGGLLKVADFGIAKVLSGERTTATVAGQVLGTPTYMAPEQARGDAATAVTDVYALGSTLYRLLSGQLPFPPAESPIAALYQRVHQPPTDLRARAPQVPHGLGEVVMRSLATDPADRFPTAEAFAVALATSATAALGGGWLAASGMRATLGGRVAAIAEGSGHAPRSGTGPVVRPSVTTSPAASPATSPATSRASDDTRPVPHHRADAEPTAVAGRMSPTDRSPTAGDAQDAILRDRITSGALPLRDDEQASALRLLDDASSVAERFGLSADASPAAVHGAVVAEVERWRRRAEHPMSPRSVVTVAQDLVRICERLLQAPPAPPG